MQIVSVALYSIIIFLATLAGIYAGLCLAAKTIYASFQQDQCEGEDGDHENSPLRRTKRRSKKSTKESVNSPGNKDDKIIRKRQDTDDSYRILKRRQKQDEP